ncbi:MAG: mechanosensitive ion channel family protein [Candidatus Omnitrophota bacterium]
MNLWLNSLPANTRDLLVPLAILAATMLIGYLLRRIVFSRLVRWSQNTSSKVDDIIIAALKKPFMLLVLILGVYFGMDASRLPQDFTQTVDRVLFVLGILVVTAVLANIAGNLIKSYSIKLQSAMPITSLTQNVARLIIFAVGIMVILNSLGISIAPILATLGVGGLAVALALQDTLSNLFSGFYIILSKQIRVGDYIRLDSGDEGYVTDINWRTTKIKMLPNNIILVPNEKLTKAIITNYYLPDKEMAVLVNLGVHYNSDLKKVERVTCEVAKQVLTEVTGGAPEFEPFIRYGSFSDFSINLTVILRVKEFVDQYLVKHEFIKRLQERYAREGIVIPYPIRAINYAQEKEK